MSDDSDHTALTALDPNDRLNPAYLEWIQSKGETGGPLQMLVRAAKAAALLHYFSDHRHSMLDEPPLPDGSNIQHIPLLKDTYDWYRKWMVFLHQKSLLGFWPEGEADLGRRFQQRRAGGYIPEIDDLEVGWVLENLEKKLYSPSDDDLSVVFQHRPELAWVGEWRESILKALSQIQIDAAKAHGNGPEQDAAVHSVFADIPPATWLLVRLICAEERFEEELCYWHVEDEHMCKRIFLLDEHKASKLLLNQQALPTIYAYYRPIVLGGLRRISAKARKNFYFRMLRDWGPGRAWKKLELVVEAKGKEKTELKETVAAVRNLFATSGKLGKDLFGVHPVDLEDVEKSSEARCPACWMDFEDGDLRMITDCDHGFHPECILQHWDQPARLVYDCPKCRQLGRPILSRIELEDWEIGKKNDTDHTRFSDEALEGFKAKATMAKNWETDPDVRYGQVRGGDYRNMPRALWTVWAKSVRRDLVEKEQEDDPKEISNKAPDPTADWPKQKTSPPRISKSPSGGLDDVE